MGNNNVIFTFDGRDIAIQCSSGDKMRDVCQKFAEKAETNINSLIFLYGDNQVNMNLSLEAQASSIDNKNKEMKILVYRKENEDELSCPKCGEKISLNSEKINHLISSNDNLRDSKSGIQNQLDNVIKNSTVNKNMEKDSVNDYKKIIREKDKIISNLEETNKSLYNGMKNALKSSLPFDINEGEKLMCLIIVSDDSRIHFPIICKNTHRFNELENLIYEKWPEKNLFILFFQ